MSDLYFWLTLVGVVAVSFLIGFVLGRKYEFDKIFRGYHD